MMDDRWRVAGSIHDAYPRPEALMMEFAEGQRVEVHNEQGGRFRGVIQRRDEHRIVVWPDRAALRLWFLDGYVVGRMDWGTAVRPLSKG